MKAINDLLSIMKTLRDPDEGCPWDRKQTIESISQYTLEEVYEVLDAIETDDMEGLCDELGDLLFHIVFYAEMAREAGHFDFETLADRAGEKLRRRHPHVFGGARHGDEAGLPRSWESIKQQERAVKTAAAPGSGGLLADIGTAAPALLRAEKLQRRAAAAGFDWEAPGAVLEKVLEEAQEVGEGITRGEDRQRLSEEVGDLLFSCINLSRHLQVSAETALREANRKFTRRFSYVEEQLAKQGMSLQEASFEQMEAMWQQSKQREIY